MFTGAVAFAAFVVVLPGSVITDVSWYESWMGSVAIIFSAFVLSVGDSALWPAQEVNGPDGVPAARLPISRPGKP